MPVISQVGLARLSFRGGSIQRQVHSLQKTSCLGVHCHDRLISFVTYLMSVLTLYGVSDSGLEDVLSGISLGRVKFRTTIPPSVLSLLAP
jgi:hypothetical protein